MRPISPSGRPFVSFVQVAPPSIVFHRPLPGPPPLKPKGVRRRWYEAAYSVSGLSRIHRHVDEAGVLVDELRVGPGAAAVRRLVEPALLARAPQAPERRDVDHVRAARVHHHAADVVRLREAHVLPGLAAVERLVDAVAPGGRLAVVGLAGPRVEDLRVRGCDREVADRGHELVVEDRLERGPVVRRLQDPARGGADVERRRVRLDDREVVDAPAHDRGADAAELEALQVLRRQRRPLRSWRGRGRSGRLRLGRGERGRGTRRASRECERAAEEEGHGSSSWWRAGARPGSYPAPAAGSRVGPVALARFGYAWGFPIRARAF